MLTYTETHSKNQITRDFDSLLKVEIELDRIVPNLNAKSNLTSIFKRINDSDFKAHTHSFCWSQSEDFEYKRSKINVTELFPRYLQKSSNQNQNLEKRDYSQFRNQVNYKNHLPQTDLTKIQNSNDKLRNPKTCIEWQTFVQKLQSKSLPVAFKAYVLYELSSGIYLEKPEHIKAKSIVSNLREEWVVYKRKYVTDMETHAFKLDGLISVLTSFLLESQVPEKLFELGSFGLLFLGPFLKNIFGLDSDFNLNFQNPTKFFYQIHNLKNSKIVIDEIQQINYILLMVLDQVIQLEKDQNGLNKTAQSMIYAQKPKLIKPKPKRMNIPIESESSEDSEDSEDLTETLGLEPDSENKAKEWKKLDPTIAKSFKRMVNILQKNLKKKNYSVEFIQIKMIKIFKNTNFQTQIFEPFLKFKFGKTSKDKVIDSDLEMRFLLDPNSERNIVVLKDNQTPFIKNYIQLQKKHIKIKLQGYLKILNTCLQRDLPIWTGNIINYLQNRARLYGFLPVQRIQLIVDEMESILRKWEFQ